MVSFSKHFYILHATRLRDVSLPRQDCLLHPSDVFTLARCRMSTRHINVVDNALPRIIASSVLLEETVVLFFLDGIVGVSLFGLVCPVLLPLTQILFSFGFAILFLLHLLVQFIGQVLFALLVFFFHLRH